MTEIHKRLQNVYIDSLYRLIYISLGFCLGSKDHFFVFVCNKIGFHVLGSGI